VRSGGQVFCDAEPLDVGDCPDRICKVVVEGGPLENLACEASVEIRGSVAGSVSAGNSVHCGDVRGSVTAGNSVHCGNVDGAATAGNNLYKR
jgi:hypothetical protein